MPVCELERLGMLFQRHIAFAQPAIEGVERLKGVDQDDVLPGLYPERLNG